MHEADEAGMRVALEEARRAALEGEVPVGAVVIYQGQVIARDHNRILQGGDPTAHAELLAIRVATQAIGVRWLSDCSLYVTLEPCVMCAGAIMHARIQRVIFGAPDPKTGACGSVVDLFAQPRLNHHASVSGGVLADAAVAQLQQFFAQRRGKN